VEKRIAALERIGKELSTA